MAIIVLVCFLLILFGLAAMAEDDCDDRPTPLDKPDGLTQKDWDRLQADAMLAKLWDRHGNRR